MIKLKLNFLEIFGYLYMIEILTWEFILFHQTLNKFMYKIKCKFKMKGSNYTNLKSYNISL